LRHMKESPNRNIDPEFCCTVRSPGLEKLDQKRIILEFSCRVAV
jgi:hypothetical protein